MGMWLHGRMGEARFYSQHLTKLKERDKLTVGQLRASAQPKTSRCPAWSLKTFSSLCQILKLSLFSLSLSFSPKEKVSTCSQCQMKMRQISQVTGWSSHIFWWRSVPASQLAGRKSDSKPHKYKYPWVGKCQKQRKLLKILSANSFTGGHR